MKHIPHNLFLLVLASLILAIANTPLRAQAQDDITATPTPVEMTPTSALTEPPATETIEPTLEATATNLPPETVEATSDLPATATPPDAETPTETATPTETETPTSPGPLESPIPTGTPTALPSPTRQEREPTATPTLDMSTPITPESSPTAEPTVTPTETALAEPAPLLETIPADTSVVVVNSAGTSEPLATIAAAQAVADGDPMWCPGDPISNPGDGSVFAGCKNFTTLTELIAYLASQTGSGTVYFTPTYSDYSVTFNHNDMAGLTNLTIQGGWNGLMDASYELAGQTTLSGQLSLLNWNGDITVNNIDSLVNGAYIQTDGSITINNSNFSAPGSIALVAVSGGEVRIIGSSFNNSEQGAFVNTPGRVYVSKSTFAGNTDSGLNTSSDTLTLDCVNFKGNSQDFRAQETRLISCSGEETIVTQTGGELAPLYFPPEQEEYRLILDCSKRSSFPVLLPNGDRVELFCPLSGEARISRLDVAEISADLSAENYQYISGYRVEIIKDDVAWAVIPTTGYVQASFASPAGGSNLGILYWDEPQGQWLLLNNFIWNRQGGPRIFTLNPSDQQDLRKVLSGVQHIEYQDFQVEQVSVNFLGRFVLVQR